MAKIQPFKRIIKEDYEEKDRALADKLGSSINLFADDISNAFNNNLSIEDNFNQSKKNFKVTVDSTGIPTAVLQFKSGLDSTCYGIEVVRATNLTSGSVYPTSHPFISFSENNLIITVNNISGLQTANQYQLYLILYS